MAGLLYKDFVAIKGKKIALIYLCATVLFLAIRLIFPGTDMTETIFEGDKVSFMSTYGAAYDVFLEYVLILLIFSLFSFIPNGMINVIKMDERGKAAKFISALPFGRNIYIASKYVFLAVLDYIFLLVSYIWLFIYLCNAGNDSSADFVKKLGGMLVGCFGLLLVLMAIELPFFLILGSKRGSVIKTSLLLCLCFGVIGYIFFGNLSVLKNIHIEKIHQWCNRHLLALTVVESVMLIVSLLLYYLSYRLSCRLIKDRNVQIDE